MAKDIASYFLEEGQLIVPKAKPKQYAKTLDILNTKAAVNTLSPRTYTNLVGQISRKAFDNKEISASDYYDTVMPLFGETGEMVTEKIEQYDAELDRYADGGRVNFDEGSPGKKGGNYNPSGKNQYNPPSLNKVLAILKDPKYSDYSKSDFYKKGIIGKKTLNKYEKENPNLIKYPRYGKKSDPKKTRGTQNLKMSQFNKASQGSSISMDKINNFAHFAPKLQTFLTSTQDTGPLKANVNRAAEGYDKKAITIAKEQEKLLKEKPKGYKYKLTQLNYLAANASKDANEKLGKENKNLKGTLGYFVVNPNTGEFKLKGVDRAKTFAGISGEKQEYKKMDPSKRAAFGPTQSKVQSIIDLVKSKVKGADVKRASNAPIPPKTLTANMFKGAFKGMPGGTDQPLKDPLGGQIDLIDIKKLIKKPYND